MAREHDGFIQVITQGFEPAQQRRTAANTTIGKPDSGASTNPVLFSQPKSTQRRTQSGSSGHLLSDGVSGSADLGDGAFDNVEKPERLQIKKCQANLVAPDLNSDSDGG